VNEPLDAPVLDARLRHESERRGRTVSELTARHGDLRLGTVDASVVTTAEGLKISEVAKLDRRHFSVVRPNHVPAFELLP